MNFKKCFRCEHSGLDFRLMPYDVPCERDKDNQVTKRWDDTCEHFKSDYLIQHHADKKEFI